ncbi:MAG TPA: Rrf2 family transcriptional regulator [Syntrophomonadaceae bacterium]|nr:Rrf2 family transcriptional regulator [Syntrophomonadaceae bacterium]
MEVIRRNTDYGIRALVHLASSPEKMASAAEIAESQGIPIDFLQKILQRLVRRGIVESHRGSQGGFTLAKDPRQVTVLEMVETMQGKLAMNKCFLGKDGCPRAPRCPLKQNWLSVEEKIADFLRGITLQDLVDQLRGTDSQTPTPDKEPHS